MFKEPKTAKQEKTEIIMDDILQVLNINIPYNDRLSQINKVMSQANPNFSELQLTVVSTSLNYDQSTYIITPKGLQNSKRDAKDGIVLFGYERNYNDKRDKETNNINNDNIYSNSKKNSIPLDSINNECNNDFQYNDFVFPIEEKEDNNSLYEFPNFAIYYKIEDGNYYIKDFNTGLGALMKIKKYEMKGNTLVNIGSNYLVIYINKNKISIKIFNNTILESLNSNERNSAKFELQEFEITENENFVINIGRNQQCDVIIEDMMLSKIQCYMEYNCSEKSFYLIDGNGQKESTNGTWVFILNPTRITDNFVFKAEHTLFMANLVHS